MSWLPDADALYLFTGPRFAWPLTASRLCDMDALPGVSAWVAVDAWNDPLVGHFDLTLNEGTARIGRVIVEPARRGGGLAGEMLALALQRARVLGARSMALNVIAGNTAAIRSYRRLGFTTLSSSERPDVLAMTLDL